MGLPSPSSPPESTPSLLLFDDNEVKGAKKPGKEQKENPLGYAGEGKR